MVNLRATMKVKLLKSLVYLPIFLSLFIGALNPIYAQELNSDQVKTAYLVNFIRHVNWPEDNNKRAFELAIYQNDEFYRVISKALQSRVVKKQTINVVSVQSTQAASQADLVFISVSDDIDFSTIASDLRKTSTLLVTYNSVDKHNIMLNLFLNNETSAIEFEINKSNLIYEGLTTSKELMLLGGSEIDVAQLYRETELAMQKMRQREVQLNKDLNEQARLLKTTAERLHNLDQQRQQQEQIAEQRQVELLALKKNIDRQNQAISAKEQRLENTVLQLETVKNNLTAQQKSVESKELENKTMAEKISTNRQILEQQQSQINQQGLQLDRKNVELAARSELIEQQRFYLMVLGILITIAILISALVVWLFVKNTRTTRKLSQTLTNLKNMQDQLVQSEKLASLGKLTAGVAHEINTPLGIAVTSTSSSLERTKLIKKDFVENKLTKSTMTSYFSAIEQAADLSMSSLDRVIELLSNFKQVAADQVVGEIRDINLSDYIHEIMQTLSPEMKRHRVNYQYQGSPYIILNTVPGALAQVLNNLVTNSIKHGFEQQPSGNININVIEQDDSVIVTYSDDGCGMKQEVLQNIYEPFYTTKRHSGGTGLGMNIVHNIVKQKLHGDIEIISSPNQGATFTLTLPLSIKG